MNPDVPLPVFDPDEAAERIGGDRELLDSLVEMFLAEYDGYVQSLAGPFAAGDWGTFGRSVHTLKGVLATLSANRAHAVAVRLDQAVKAGEQARYAELMTELMAELEVLLATLRQR